MGENKMDENDSMEQKEESASKEHVSKHKEHKENKEGFKLKKSEIWKYLTFLFAILLIVSVAMGGFRSSGVKGAVSADTAAADALKFINANLLQPGMTAELKEVTEKNGIYSMNLSINKQNYNSYVTKDGKLLFTSGIDMSQKIEAPATEEQEPAKTCTDKDCADPACEKSPSCTKVNKPKMSVWIVSKCPFGIQAVNGLARVYDVLKNKADFEVRYMVTNDGGQLASMHGADELTENRRQVCLREEQGYDVFMKYLRCYAETGQSTECESKSGVDSKKLATCVTDKSTEYLTKDAADWKTKYVPLGGSGSPSFFLNDFKINEYESSQNGRSPDNLRNIICSNMKTEDSACKTVLPTANPPRGFGVIESGAAATTGATAASCG